MWGTKHAVAQNVEAETCEWVQAHEALYRLAKQRAAADAEEGRCLLAALRSAAHVHLGFGSFAEYVERCFGYKPRSTQEKLRVAEALEQLPALSRSLEEGAIHWSAARALTRVAVASTELEWLEAAHGKSVRQLEELVAGKHPGDNPNSSHDPSQRRHVLRFEVAPETFALFREAMTALRRSSNSTIDDDTALLAMARHVLGGPSDEGRASYQIALSVCANCGRGRQLASGELVPVGPEVVEMARCDGQHVGQVGQTPERDGGAVGDPHSRVSVHVGANPTAYLQGRAANHNDRQPDARTRKRAKQPVPPALRRSVLLRDHRRCRIPGCRNVHFLDLHHVDLRSEGGRNEPDNLITLCGAHHRAAHRGKLHIDGNQGTGVRFRHADGSSYGHAAQPQVLAVQAKVFAALRGLGFREGEVRTALSKLRDAAAPQAATTDGLLRAALALLTPSRSHAV